MTSFACVRNMRRANQRWPTRPATRTSETGFVYLVKSGQFYKIGHSAAPGRRQYDLAIQLPEKVELIHKIPTACAEAAERFWHERFKSKRKGGEWFAVCATDVKTFKRCKSIDVKSNPQSPIPNPQSLLEVNSEQEYDVAIA